MLTKQEQSTIDEIASELVCLEHLYPADMLSIGYMSRAVKLMKAQGDSAADVRRKFDILTDRVYNGKET